MSGQAPLYHHILTQIKQVTADHAIRQTSLVRLALVVTGIIAARSCVLRQVAAELFALGLTQAGSLESIERRLRRTLNDGRLSAERTYRPLLRQVVDWSPFAETGQPVVLIIDESSKTKQLHLLRVSLAYRGGSLPLAWAVWEQNRAQARGHYWRTMDRVLAAVAAVLPSGLEVIVLADRAYDVPAFIDRITAYGWSWVVRCKARGTLRYRDQLGRDQSLAAVLDGQLPAAGTRWKGRGWAFKKAGWRPVSVVALWGIGYREPLVVLSNLPPTWRLVRLYQRRFWIEPGFRTDKRKGWQWEASQVRDREHQERLLLAMAWASLVLLCLGSADAEGRLAARLTRPARRPQHQRASLFMLGLQQARQWLYGTSVVGLTWRLPEVPAEGWGDQWLSRQRYRLLFQPVRP